MVAPVDKNTTVRLILIFCDVIFCMLAKQFGGQKSLAPLEKPFEIAD
jgi:hypothetical protein